MISTRLASTSLICVALISALACSADKNDAGPTNQKEKDQASDLRLFVLGYETVLQNDHVPPGNAAKLLERISSDRPVLIDNYEIIWGINLAEVDDKKNTVLAYVKDVPKNGGMVAFVDGSVRRVASEEFGKLPQAKRSTAPKKADFAPTLKQFSDDINSGPPARVKYQGKVVDLNGVVRGFESSSDFDPPKSFNDSIILKSGEDGASVKCVMLDSQPWAKYSIGQSVALSGTYPTGKGFPILVGCVVSKATESKSPISTAEALTMEMETNAEAAKEKYSKNSLIVTGEATKAVREQRSVKLTLKSTPKTSVTCEFKGTGREATKELAVGTRVKVFAESARFEKDEIVLEKCQLIVE